MTYNNEFENAETDTALQAETDIGLLHDDEAADGTENVGEENDGLTDTEKLLEKIDGLCERFDKRIMYTEHERELANDLRDELKAYKKAFMHSF